MTVFSMILDILMAAVAVAMLIKGHYGVTKQLAFIPLAIASLDASFATVITYEATLALSLLLTALQIAILFGSVTLLHEDRAHARNQQERRRRRHEVLRTQAAFEQAAGRSQKQSITICA